MLNGEKLFMYESAVGLYEGLTDQDYNDSLLEEDGRSIIFCCTCGMVECDNISMMIDIKDDDVTWKYFGLHNREPFLHFGTFKFTKANYEACLNGLSQYMKDK